MQKIIFLKGLPASGKSTWAKKYCIEHLFVERVNKDDIRDELGNPIWSRAFEEEVLKIQRQRGEELISQGKSLIVDDTNFAEKHENYWRDIAKKYGYEFEIKFFDTPVEECIRRDKGREKSVGEGIIMDMYKKYLKPNNIKNDNRFILEQNENLPRAIICDIDGTLALMNNRNPFDERNYITDHINKPVLDILRKYTNTHIIILLSGRMETGLNQTKQWLLQNNVPYDWLFMRADKDFRADDIVKKELFNKYVAGNFHIDFVLDDRDSVVKMWRDLGLLCLQVYYGNF